MFFNAQWCVMWLCSIFTAILKSVNGPRKTKNVHTATCVHAALCSGRWVNLVCPNIGRHTLCMPMSIHITLLYHATMPTMQKACKKVWRSPKRSVTIKTWSVLTEHTIECSRKEQWTLQWLPQGSSNPEPRMSNFFSIQALWNSRSVFTQCRQQNAKHIFRNGIRNKETSSPSSNFELK